MRLPYQQTSLWRDSYPARCLYPSLRKNLKVDVAIVGAGITGLTTAYLLKRAGLKIAVIEKDTIGGGTTGRATGKVTSQHSLIYADLAQRLGRPMAQTYGEANQAAVEQVSAIVKKERLDCDWAQDDNYVYTTDPRKIKTFKREAEAAAGLGLPASFETASPLPFEVRGAVKFSGQGKINAQKYLLGLAKYVDGDGSHVFEKSDCIGIRGNRVRTRHGKVHAKNVVVATNVPTMPLMARGGYCLLEYPTESCIVAGRPAKNLKGMYISPDKNHYSILPIQVEGKSLLLIAGENRLPWQRHKQDRYHRLADYAEEHFGLTAITHHWSDRDYTTYDGPPLIGRVYPWSKHLYVGTAYRKWGLSNGTAAAMILSDRILGRPNKWAAFFEPMRLKPVTSIPRVFAGYVR